MQYNRNKLKKRAGILALLFILIFAVCAFEACNKNNEPQNTMANELKNGLRNKVSSMLSINIEKSVSVADAEVITRDMTLKDIIGLIGKPQRVCGVSCSNILEWDLNDGKYLRVLFNIYDTNSNVFMEDPNNFKVVRTYIGNVKELKLDETRRISKDFTSIFQEKTEKIIIQDDISKLHPLMTLGEVVDIIGHPQRDMGSGAIILEWDVPDGKKINITVSKNGSTENVYDYIVSDVT